MSDAVNALALPAKCPNGHIFLSQSFKFGPNVRRVFMHGNYESCPVCNAPALIATGGIDSEGRMFVYGEAIKLFRELERQDLLIVQEALAAARTNSKPLANVIKDITSVNPAKLTALKSIIPEKRMHRSEWLDLLSLAVNTVLGIPALAVAIYAATQSGGNTTNITNYNFSAPPAAVSVDTPAQRKVRESGVRPPRPKTLTYNRPDSQPRPKAQPKRERKQRSDSTVASTIDSIVVSQHVNTLPRSQRKKPKAAGT